MRRTTLNSRWACTPIPKLLDVTHRIDVLPNLPLGDALQDKTAKATGTGPGVAARSPLAPPEREDEYKRGHERPPRRIRHRRNQAGSIG